MVLQCINGVSSNPVEGRTKIWQLQNLILTLFGLIFRRIYICIYIHVCNISTTVFRVLYIYSQYIASKISTIYFRTSSNRRQLLWRDMCYIVKGYVLYCIARFFGSIPWTSYYCCLHEKQDSLETLVYITTRDKYFNEERKLVKPGKRFLTAIWKVWRVG